MSSKSAIIFGATGLVGRALVQVLKSGGQYNRLILATRRATGDADDITEDLIMDFEDLAENRLEPDDFSVDHVYLCLGTTHAIAGSHDAFRRVDHDYVLAAAAFARKAGATRAALVSSTGANAKSSASYMKCKGQVEDGVKEMGFDQLSILRPGLLMGGDRPGPFRMGEWLAQQTAPLYTPLLCGSLRQYRPIDHNIVAAAMAGALEIDMPGVNILLHDDIQELAKIPLAGQNTPQDAA